MQTPTSDTRIEIDVLGGVCEIDAADWDACIHRDFCLPTVGEVG